jgi:hypothetical protein
MAEPIFECPHWPEIPYRSVMWQHCITLCCMVRFNTSVQQQHVHIMSFIARITGELSVCNEQNCRQIMDRVDDNSRVMIVNSATSCLLLSNARKIKP